MSGQLALPEATVRLLKGMLIGSRHPGLQLDKFSAPGDQAAQKAALADVVRTTGDRALLDDLMARRRTALDGLGARFWWAETTGALTLHLARASALENAGICLHPVYGFVYLPGSGLKGMARAYAETVWLPAQPEPVEAWKRIERVFGWTPETDRVKAWKPKDVPSHSGDDRSRVGAVVFHDAWPVTWPTLIVDITNNHHTGYYQGTEAPGDWENPVPVYFLAASPGTAFSFALTVRDPTIDPSTALHLAGEWLMSALCHAGAGAKTAAGYGSFRVLDRPAPEVTSPAIATWETTVKLITPAFLAGANQEVADCDLRPATLRGLLRWWWRTLHAGFVDVKTLRNLEAAVWGDTETGGAVRIVIEPFSGTRPIPYDKALVARAHQLEAPPPKTSQGLFYSSYGMDEGQESGRSQRWRLDTSTAWRVRLSARASQYSALLKADDQNRLAPDKVLDQAKTALWLLCRYGGAGSKSRRGFASLSDVDGLTLDDGKAIAHAFRKHCGLPDRDEREAETPSLGSLLDLEVPTPWKDPWFALDQLGYSAQSFAQRYKHKAEKAALGLPRQISGPRQRPLRGQDETTHRPPQRLTAPKGSRHTAPVHYHLAAAPDGTLIIRASAFPSPYLPDRTTSRRMLGELLDHLRQNLEERIRKHGSKGSKAPAVAPAVGSQSPPAPPPSPVVLQRGERIAAVLLEEKTSKGGWKARQDPTGWSGYIMNSSAVPGDLEPGAKVILIVDIPKQHDFRLLWPTPEVEDRIPKSSGRPSKSKGLPRRRR